MNSTEEITITDKDHKQMVKEGADPEYALKPGKYKATRDGFLNRHADKRELEHKTGRLKEKAS